jgi:hemolysin III
MTAGCVTATPSHDSQTGADTVNSIKAARNIKRSIREYTTGEEVANSITHGIGAALGIAALVLLALRATTSPDVDTVGLAAVLVFGITLILEYIASTLYHALTAPRAKKVFKVLDHCSIYLLIAGTYTPFCLITLTQNDGLLIFALVWGVALAGIATEAFWVFRPRWLAAVVYLAMSWVIIFKAGDILALAPTGALALLLAGGICYTLGIVFYLLKRVRYMHSIWHLWTIAGSVCHFLAIYLFVI